MRQAGQGQGGLLHNCWLYGKRGVLTGKTPEYTSNLTHFSVQRGTEFYDRIPIPADAVLSTSLLSFLVSGVPGGQSQLAELTVQHFQIPDPHCGLPFDQ